MKRHDANFWQMLLIVWLMLAFSPTAKAYFEFNGYYASNTLTTTSAATSNRTFFEASLGFSIDRDSRYMVGWNYGSFSATDASGGVTTAYSSTQMGPKFIYGITKSKSWTFGLAYNLVTTGNYDNGGGNPLKWSGTAIKAELSYNFNVMESWLVGMRLNYASATYTSQLSGATTYSTNSNSSSYIYPSVCTFVLF